MKPSSPSFTKETESLFTQTYVPEMEIALGGAGRYDKLIELFGGEPTPAVGVALGIDRLLLAMKRQRSSPKIVEEKHVMIIPISEELKARAIKLSSTLRRAKIPVEVMGRTVSKALSDADRRKVTHALIVGSEKLKEEVVLRDMEKREQKIVEINNLLKEILESYQVTATCADAFSYLIFKTLLIP